MKCTIIIVNYNTKKVTEECIVSVQKHTENISYEIILVDNNSQDGSAEYFASFPGVQLISSKENLGFGRANNLAAQQAKGTYLLFLNSDTLLTENSIEKMVRFFEENETTMQIGSLGVPLTNSKHEVVHSAGTLPTVGNLLSGYISSFVNRNYYQKKVEDEIKQYKKPVVEVGYVTGADLMMRKSVFMELGGFDPEFFMYYEDAFLGHKLQEIKKKNYIANPTQIIHLEGESFKKVNLLKRMMVEKSMFIYLRKTNSGLKYTMFRVLFFLINFPMIILKARRPDSKAYLRHLMN